MIRPFLSLKRLLFDDKASKVRYHYSRDGSQEESMDYVPSKGWAEMIRKVYEIDPQLSLSCGSKMSIISFIEEPKTIDRIIHHLELTFEAERPAPPHPVQQDLLMAAEEREEFNYLNIS